MQCEDLADDLAATADGSVLLGRGERRHVEQCLRCQAELVQYRRVPHFVDRQARLIGIDQRDIVRTWDVAVIGDRKFGRQRNVTPGDASPGNRRANSRPVDHSVE